MSIILDVGSDLFGTKTNVQLKFGAMPTLGELTAATEAAFDTKARATRPAGYPDVPFRIETFQIFDDTLMRWVDLYDARQLRNGVQMWCFQPESIWHSDAQGVIPEAEKTVATFTTPLGSPRRARIATDAGVPPTLSEKLRSVFYQVDGTNKGYLLYQDLERAFQMCEMEFTAATAGDLFMMADQNRSQHITYDEWVNFAIKAPGVIDALFFRMRDMYQDRMPSGSPPPHHAQIQRQDELNQMYQSQWDAQAKQRQEQEFMNARRMAEEQARSAASATAAAHQSAQQAAQQQAAAERAAKEAADQHAAAQAAAQAAAANHAAAKQQAQQAAAQQAAAEQSALATRSHQPMYSSPPPIQRSPSAGMQVGSSPQRDQALREYELARRKADEIRLAKEEAEREERNAWDRCYYAPASPHYGPGSRGY